MKRKSGFTILELALAMAFISFLLLAIGMVTVQVSRIYQKGITIKMTSSTGRELVDEFSRTILASKYDTFSGGNGDEKAEHFEYTYTGQRYDTVEGIDKEVPFYGAFCTGTYSYIWNTGYALKQPDTSKKARLIDANDGTVYYGSGSFRLLRINDAGRQICVNYAKDNNLNDRYEDNDKYENTFKFDGPLTNPTELLSASEGNLVFYDFVVYEPAYDVGTGDALFPASFILGTYGDDLSKDVDITTSGDFCKQSPDNLNTDFTYCSINKFNFAARATGGIII